MVMAPSSINRPGRVSPSITLPALPGMNSMPLLIVAALVFACVFGFGVASVKKYPVPIKTNLFVTLKLGYAVADASIWIVSPGEAADIAELTLLKSAATPVLLLTRQILADTEKHTNKKEIHKLIRQKNNKFLLK